VDMSQRERVRLLWTIEGNHGLRVHKGLVYMYHPHGAFQLYKGYPPEPVPHTGPSPSAYVDRCPLRPYDSRLHGLYPCRVSRCHKRLEYIVCRRNGGQLRNMSDPIVRQKTAQPLPCSMSRPHACVDGIARPL
jgi:hypothetical protein